MRFFQKAAMVIALTMLGGATTVLADSMGGHTSYIGNNLDNPVHVPDAQAAWSQAMDKPAADYMMGEGTAVTDGERVFFLQNGKLAAVQASTGKKLWAYGGNLKAPLLADGGRVYAMSDDGRPVSVNAKTGSKLWASKTTVKDARKLYSDGGRLYVQSAGVTAFRISDGNYSWKQGDYYGDLVFKGNYMLAASVVSGAYSYDVLHAVDCRTGKQAWELANESLPIDIRGGILLSERQGTIFNHVLLTTLDSIDLATGKIVKTRVYNPERVDVAKIDFYGPGQAWVQGDDVFIAYGNTVYRYSLLEDPATAKRDSYTAQQGVDLRYAAGPYDGRVFYSNGDGVYGVKMVNKSPVFYNGGMSNPVARFDLIGHGMYVAQTDGRLIAMDLITAEPVVRLNTGARVFGPTLKIGAMIVVQAQGKLIAFKEPARLALK
ncbi:PQQ-binding-like beta-propeller repeat protein [Paenibacillus sacheonensis]|uniref:PQQ-binding-like beta-propeller repeat protein n=1 Tax=Paenibacillus sacheonensis TaxID=742054 RepID=A0A7X5C4Q3_9BACL|nr:PQQ-binding-like beta-propeller repeat protein [Paenibacillus sacheonensis]MBM7569010.1 outer membrane protein assembly factor BamB [Paenibacillus sacheonensis]NBC72619.1 PQQ-binding-like beta-propeller repeat protein [Paenibacillus sacheonensis]